MMRKPGLKFVVEVKSRVDEPFDPVLTHLGTMLSLGCVSHPVPLHLHTLTLVITIITCINQWPLSGSVLLDPNTLCLSFRVAPLHHLIITMSSIGYEWDTRIQVKILHICYIISLSICSCYGIHYCAILGVIEQMHAFHLCADDNPLYFQHNYHPQYQSVAARIMDLQTL